MLHFANVNFASSYTDCSAGVSVHVRFTGAGFDEAVRRKVYLSKVCNPRHGVVAK